MIVFSIISYAITPMDHDQCRAYIRLFIGNLPHYNTTIMIAISKHKLYFHTFKKTTAMLVQFVSKHFS